MTADAAPTRTYNDLQIMAATPASRSVSFDVFLPLRNTAGLDALLAAQQDKKSPQYHKWLTPAQFKAQFGPTRATFAKVIASLRARGFTVTENTRSVRATGSAGAFNTNFGTQLVMAKTARAGDVQHVVSTAALKMPAELAAVNAQIYSFAPHVSHPYSTRVGSVSGSHTPKASDTDNRYSDTGPYWYTDLKQAYEYPSAKAKAQVGETSQKLDGRGAIIAAMMASDVLDSDIQAMFDHEHWTDVTGKPAPKLAARINIFGGAPFDINAGVSFESALDIQQELGGAPGAAVVLYNIPDLSDGSVFAGYVTMLDQNIVDVMSLSFGLCEAYYTPEYNGGVNYRGELKAQNELFKEANAQGITVLASSGDHAGKECIGLAYFNTGSGQYVTGVSNPAADPNVVAVGGTNLVTRNTPGSLGSGYVGENAWADPEIRQDPYGTGGSAKGAFWGAGGGYSHIFKKPAIQNLVNTGSDTWRAIPDIGMQVGGCPGGTSKLNANGDCDGGNREDNGSGNTQRSAAVVSFGVGQGGGNYGVIGTSVSSPEFAGVVAHLVQLHGRQGDLKPYIYGLAAQQANGVVSDIYHTNIPGFNGVQDTNLNPAYSLSTGVGTPRVVNFLGLPDMEKAGKPQSKSNP
ncbi:MAG TPA: protease pro-enzyme activation domain-containing protein [Rhizomicrobium sp.]|nr:protease pro-enzyme activation domain-containing protein [Rhizomicrobium sp.]